MFGFGKDNNSSKKSNRISDEKFKEALQNEIALMHIMKDPDKMKGQFPDVDKFSMNPNRQSLRTVTAYFIQNPKAAANLLKKNNLNDLRAHLYPEEEANRWGMSEEDWSDARRPKLRERISKFIGMQEGGQVKDRFGYGSYQEKQPDLQGFLNSDEHKEWLNSSWDSENDIHMLKAIVGAMAMHGGYGEKDTQRYLEDYMTMLKQASNKKGSPPPKELHKTLIEMQYGKR